MTPLRRRMIEDMQLRGSPQGRKAATWQLCASSRSTITGVRTSSQMRTCASTSCTWPMRRRLRARRRPSPCVGSGSSSFRADAPPRVDDAPVRASGPRAQTTGRVESRRGAPRGRGGADSGLPRLSDDDLCLRAPVARRGAPAGRRCRQCANGGARARQRQTRSLRPAAGPDPPGAAGVLANASLARVDVSRTHPSRPSAQSRQQRRARHPQ